MGNSIGEVDWFEINEKIHNLLNQEEALMTYPIDQGFEAEVIKICLDKESFILKVWNKNSKPDVSFQYRLLKDLFFRGLPVSNPIGWGVNSNVDKVLLTTFNGLSVTKTNKKKMAAIANVLTRIHQIPVEEVRNLKLPKYNFSDYFFPGVKEHNDLNGALNSLFQIVEIKQNRIIHGDFHLGNIVEENDRYTVIDWTNGQLGDSRYDFAWSLMLQKIYIPYGHAQEFCSSYLLDNNIQQEELEAFEALACLRWILLNRNGGVPKRPNTIEMVQSLITNNSFLKELELKDFPIKNNIEW